MPPKQQKQSTKSQKDLKQPKNNDLDTIDNSQDQNYSDNDQKSEIDNLDDFKFSKTKNESKIQKTKKEKKQISYELPKNSERVTRKRLVELNLKETQEKENKQTSRDKKDGKKDLLDDSSNETDQINDQEEQKKDMGEQKKKVKYNCKENYEEIYRLIKTYRDAHTAPVDTLGCHMQGDETLPLNDKNFQKLMAIILSVQTKDETTDMVMKKVIKERITIDKAVEIPSDELKGIISQVNFNAKKVEYIKNAAEIIKNNYNYVTPDKYDDLIKIKGIGPKVANLFLQCAYNKTVGIAVDTHVHRISNRLEWVNTKTPEQTRLELEKFLDKKYWEDVNQLLVGYGQSVCKPINPQCQICPVKDKCPEGRRRMKGKKKI